MALNNIFNVGERFISNAGRFWWKYRIAFEFGISPREVEQWDADEVMEALAAIGLRNKNTPEGGNTNP